MDQQTRLTKLIRHCTSCEECRDEDISAHLLENGVIVPPCRIGEKIFILVSKRPRINLPEFTFIKESRLTYLNLERVIKEYGKNVFLTRDDAKAEFERRFPDAKE